MQILPCYFHIIAKTIQNTHITSNPSVVTMNSILMKLLFPPPPSLFVTAMTVISGVSLANAGFTEIKGKHMQYSKFFNLGIGKSSDQKDIKKSTNSSGKDEPVKLSGRNGMILAYAPAFLAGAASFVVLPLQSDLRLLLVASALTIHFLKRVLEGLFLHKYSGSMPLESAVTISMSYFLSTATMIYTQYLSTGSPEPTADLKYAGVGIFLIGIAGNFYHHYLLSKLRDTASDKEYKIPKGGLFDLVICPHYLFEILGFVGVTCISQTLYSLSFTVGTTMYLMGRSYATRKWYVSKFEDFPSEVKSLVPYIF